MGVFDNIFNGMARGFAFGMMGFNPFYNHCCCNYNPLYFTSNPFMGGGFFPVMPQLSMPVFNMSPPAYNSQTWQMSDSLFEFSDDDFKKFCENSTVTNPFWQWFNWDAPVVAKNDDADVDDSDDIDTGNESRTRTSSDVGDTFTRTTKPKKTQTSARKKQKTDYVSTTDRYYTQMRDFIIRELEGGYSDVKGDKGSKTNKGVTQGTYDKFRKKWGQTKQSVRKITDEEVDKIYHSFYIEAGVDKIKNPRLALYVFAQAINSGSSVAKSLLEQSGGNVDKYEQLQRERYHRLANKKDQGQFRDGWQNRVTKTKDFAMNNLPDNMDVLVA